MDIWFKLLINSSVVLGPSSLTHLCLFFSFLLHHSSDEGKKECKIEWPMLVSSSKGRAHGLKVKAKKVDRENNEKGK